MEVVSPSEVQAASAGPIRIGGRVVGIDAQTLLIADAFGSLQLELNASSTAPPAIDDLIVVEASQQPMGRWQAEICYQRRPIKPRQPNTTEHGRLFGRGVGARLRKRAEVMAAARRFFAERGYLEVDTPAVVPCPGLDLHLDAFALQRQGNSEPERYLNTSPEYQMKRLLAGGMSRIFQFARCFRRGEHGRRHNPEFVMLEWYRAFASMGSMMQQTEELVRSILTECTEGSVTALGDRRLDLAAPFARISVCEAFDRYAGASRAQVLQWADDDEERFFRVLIEKIEPALAELGTAAFLFDYPSSQASLARRKPGDEQLCERFELYVGDLELCNGFGELTDPVEQRERLVSDQRKRAAQDLAVYPIDHRFLEALEQGLPPCAGNALGVDRLVQLCCNAEDIGDTMPFPVQWI